MAHVKTARLLRRSDISPKSIYIEKLVRGNIFIDLKKYFEILCRSLAQNYNDKTTMPTIGRRRFRPF